MSTITISEAVTRPFKTRNGDTFFVAEQAENFKTAVSWCFHGEPVDEIVETLKFDGDIEKVEIIASYLELCGYDFDDVYSWGESK